ncbi:Uma2 family endonuclease [Umezawaea sp. Da 62-37]|uniref:Uma2 family endonuclease n=1 Tax=Umezawaea sp. Da 62-37 TaxID=3075927 RepID=UPI0028F6D922|nr:Uma2 family endonuclease [Umezawaea sp. Da 62-37]WNV90157.1 Uma2 family endonuclease [Umezawaea sp. Da 62-37]
MTALPVPPNHLLTIAEYASLGEVESGYTELLEGCLFTSPSPTPDHNFASVALVKQLLPQLPDEVFLIPDVDVDLEFAPSRQPGSSRRPDLVLVGRDALMRVRAEGGLLRASEVLVIAEIVSPGSRRTDYVAKLGEYADAGIPHYWIIDIVEPVSLIACHLAGEFGYQQAPAVTGGFATTEPFPITIDVDRLRLV